MVIQQPPTNSFFPGRASLDYSAGNGHSILGDTAPRFTGVYTAQSSCTALVSPPRLCPQAPVTPVENTNRYTPGILGRYSTVSPPVDGKPEVGEMWYDGYLPTTRSYYSYSGYGCQARFAPTSMNDPGHRKNATRESTSTLKAWLQEHSKNPYPSKGEKVMLAVVSKMTLTQVSTWFANARRRLKKENKMTWIPKHRPNDSASLSSQQSTLTDQSMRVADAELEDKPKSKMSCTNNLGLESPPISNVGTSQGGAAILDPALRTENTGFPRLEHNNYNSPLSGSYYPCNNQPCWENNACPPRFSQKPADLYNCSQPIVCGGQVPMPNNYPYLSHNHLLPKNIGAFDTNTSQNLAQNDKLQNQMKSFCQAPTNGYCNVTEPVHTQQSNHVITANQSPWRTAQTGNEHCISSFSGSNGVPVPKSGSNASFSDDFTSNRGNEGSLSTGYCSENANEPGDWYSSKNEDSSPEPQCDLNYSLAKSSWEQPVKFSNNIPVAQQQVW